ncbi:MAG: hypothetical protein N3A69_11420, partial [Leptospiraceae bacterium]|nr:hypothetical protein [Leptospiraceae bacterium]
MDLIVGIETTKEAEEELKKNLSNLKQKSVVINFFDRVEDYVRSARPSVVVMAYEPDEKPFTNYIKKLKQDPSTRDIPVIAILSKRDPNFPVTYKRLGFSDFLVKPVDKFDLEAKVNEAIRSVKQQRGGSKNIEVQRSFKKTAIVFNASLARGVLPEIKNVLTAPVLKAISGDKICIDLRNVPSLAAEEVVILERLTQIFGQKRIAIVAGKYMGLIIAN